MSHHDPTAKQLAFIADLCEQTGVKVPVPTSAATAKRQIDSLLKLRQAPTPNQLAYLEQLASLTGCSFDWPKTRTEAGELISQLKDSLDPEAAQDTTGQLERSEHRPYSDGFAHFNLNASGVHPDEVKGYGSDARWA